MKNLFNPRSVAFCSSILFVLFILTWSCERQAEPPVVITGQVADVSISKCSTGGEVTDDGGGEIRDRGIMWGLYNGGVEGMSHDGTGTGSFDTKLTGLKPNSQYYVRAYATNGSGTGYGEPVLFTTLVGVADIDCNEYNTVVIGTQTWMKQNLKTTKYNDGTAITLLTNESAYTDPTYCWYNFDVANKDIYGGYYSYAAVTTGKLCPTGWHVPSKTEWETLDNYMGGPLVAGKKLKTTTGWYNSGNGTDEFGFSAIPAGYRLNDFDEFNYAGQVALWWIANEQSTRYIKFDIDYLYHMTIMNPTSNAVRCVKN